MRNRASGTGERSPESRPLSESTAIEQRRSIPSDKTNASGEGVPIWARPEPAGRQPRYSRDQIAATAVKIADSEGFEALSMRRIAAELGAGTMTLYHYVQTKDELVTLMSDAIMSELLVPDDELPDDWRGGLTAIAHRTKDTMLAHPWVFGKITSPQMGPNTLRHVDQSLSVAARTGLNSDEQLELITTVDDYVTGFVTRFATATREHDSASNEPIHAAIFAYVESQVGTGEFPELERVFGGGDVPAAFERMAKLFTDEERFSRGLNQLLDGVELQIKSWQSRS